MTKTETKYRCDECNEEITEAVHKYSEEHFSVPLCMKHQALAKKKVDQVKKETNTGIVRNSQDQQNEPKQVPKFVVEELNTKEPRMIQKKYKEQEKWENVWDKLSSINVDGFTETKGNLKYLSWSHAWTEVKKQFHDADFHVYENGQGFPYFADRTGGMVKVGVSIANLEHVIWLPIMDIRNKTIPIEKITTFDINKSIMRALAKALALHGLGINIYRGEDFPEEENGN